MGSELAGVYIITLNTVFAIFTLFLNVITKRKHGLIKAFVVLFCPIVGPVFLLLSYLAEHTLFSKPVDLDDVVFSKERVKSFIRADENTESNMVPLEEAIEISDTKELRNLMMNVAKGDAKKLLSAISLALNSGDSETSHYAASVLQEELSKFRDSVRNNLDTIKENGVTEQINVEAFIENMNQILSQNVFTEVEQKSFVKAMDEICEIYYEEKPETVSSAVMEAITLRFIDIGNYDGAMKWVKRAKFHHPEELATYTAQLKLYFSNGDKERFFDTARELKSSTIILDNDTLERIRVFE